MPQFTPINRDSHAGKSWRRPTDYAFAAGEAVVPLVGAELAHAVVATLAPGTVVSHWRADTD